MNGETDNGHAVDPKAELLDTFTRVEFDWTMLTPFPDFAIVGGMVVGALILAWGMLQRPRHRTAMLGGAGVMLLAVAAYVLLALVILYLVRRRRRPGWQRRGP